MNESTTPAPETTPTPADDAITPVEETAQSHAESSSQPAEDSTKETQPDTSVEPSSPDPELIEWAKNKGIPVDSPEALTPAALKAIEVARNGERDFHASRQGASTKLKDTAGEAVSTGDELADQVRLLQVQSNIRDFEDGLRDKGLKKSDIEAIKDEVADVLIAKPHLVGDLEAAYAIVNNAKSDKLLEDAKRQGREEAKAEIARASSSTMPKGNASGNTPREDVDPGLAAFDAAF